MSFAAILMVIGAIASTIGAGINQGQEMFLNSMAILPNYIYWGVIVVTIGNSALKTTGLLEIYKMFFWGLVATMATYYSIGSYLSGFPLYRRLSPNSFAFILILFSPMATVYLNETKKNGVYTLLFVIMVMLAGFLSGSRTGSLLAVTGSLLALSLNNWLRILLVVFFAAFIGISAPQILSSPLVKSGIHGLNERTYELIYSTDETLSTDRSYLTRLAMIEKGLNIFNDHPIEGVGVNNFTRVVGEIDFNFEGSEYIEGKEDTLSEGLSAHNSYISFLAEGGLLLFIPMLILLFYPTVYFISNFNQIKNYEKAIFISIIFMSIHSWFISGLLNVFGWFVLGIVNSYIINKNNITSRIGVTA
jgi:O-antigen ligase